MLDGYRRGFQFGADLATNQPTLLVSTDVLRSILAWLLAYYHTKGWAHLDPLDRAIDGAIAGFTAVRVMKGAS